MVETIRKEDALRYHAEGRPGKLETLPTKPVSTQHDLALAYTPGVAEPCREIYRERRLVGTYTARRNLVAVVSNGSAVLGLGNLGPYAAKPVMEGKAVLFKKFAGIDVFDLELDAHSTEQLVDIIAALEPTFGGINLEDIKAPECFEVERELKRRMGIPVFHDDQHGTAIITAAGLLNAAELQGHALDTLQVVCIGAGASAIACMELWIQLGVRREHITMLDSRGVIREGRPGALGPYKQAFARPTDDPRRTFPEALEGAHVLIGLSSGGSVDVALLKRMAPRPMVFALANPDPEVPYHVALQARPDAIVATGRSDLPNQINNVLGFPFIFRGALDVGATCINDAMKIAAARALAGLAKESVPQAVREVYPGETLSFGPEYLIPKPFDVRALSWVSSAVAEAAMRSGVALEPVDLAAYRAHLDQGPDRAPHRAAG